MTIENTGKHAIIGAHFSVHWNAEVATAPWRFQAGKFREILLFVSQCHCKMVRFGCGWHSTKILLSNTLFN